MSPPWEHRWHGRLQYELDALKRAGATYEIDVAAAAGGQLILDDLRWPLENRVVRLRAVYPDNFPDIRPQVYAPDEPEGRHVHPVDHGVCLLGRGTENWSDMSLADLLQQQLERALAASSDPLSDTTAEREEHEGLPAEEWWNAFSVPGSYCLIDTAWSIDRAHDHGRLTLRYAFVPSPYGKVIRAFVERVVAADGQTILAQWSEAIPPELRSASSITVPWVRAADTPLPRAAPPDFAPFLTQHSSFAKSPRIPIDGWRATFHCILYDTELSWRKFKDGWLFLYTRSRQDRHRKQVNTMLLRSLRAGVDDLGTRVQVVGTRVPVVKELRKKRVAVFGIGAIGAPIAVELARNGCGELLVVEHDVIEPGNSVRWPLGASAWGTHKTLAIAEFIKREYPATTILPVQHMIGGPLPDGIPPEFRSEAILTAVLDRTDLVIDATAEVAINWLLNDRCRERSIPLITAHATPNIQGGLGSKLINMLEPRIG